MNRILFKLFVVIILFLSNKTSFSQVNNIEGHWHVTYQGDLIFPLNAWQATTDFHVTGNDIRGNGEIIGTGYRFSQISLDYDPTQRLFHGKWSDSTCIQIQFDGDINSLIGTITLDENLNPKRISGPILFTRLDRLPGNEGKSIIKAEEAVEKFSKGIALVNTEITGDLVINESSFINKVIAINCVFKGDVDFTEAKFLKGVDFSNSIFKKRTSFIGSQFTGHANFADVHFYGDTYFSFAEFLDRPHVTHSFCFFNEVWFHKNADFRGSKFKGVAYFEESNFSAEVSFLNSKFETIDFRNSKIDGSLYFIKSCGKTLILGGIECYNFYLSDSHLDQKLSYQTNFMSELSSIAGHKVSKIHGVLSIENSNAHELILDRIAVKDDITIIDNKIGNLSILHSKATKIELWNNGLNSSINTDYWSSRFIFSSTKDLFPTGEFSLESKVLIELSKNFNAIGAYDDMNKALIESEFKKFDEKKGKRGITFYLLWSSFLLIGFGRSISIIVLISLLIVTLAAIILFSVNKSKENGTILVLIDRTPQLKIHFRRPPILPDRSNGRNANFWDCYKLSLASFFKVNFGNVYVIRSLGIRIVVWTIWILGLVYLYAFISSLASSFPIINQLWNYN